FESAIKHLPGNPGILTGTATMGLQRNPITEAILQDAKDQLEKEYTKAQSFTKVKGWLRNKFYHTTRSLTGGSTDFKSQGKQVGMNAFAQGVPKVVDTLTSLIPLKQLPGVSSAVGLISGVAKDKIVGYVQEKFDDARKKELSAKQSQGTLTVAEMTEKLQLEETSGINSDVAGKLQDAIRKVDQAYTDASDAIRNMKDCESIHAAAHKYAYLCRRVVRLNYYIAAVRVHIDAIQEVADRYSST